MSFDYSKFLAENQLTTTSRIKAQFLREEEEDAGVAAGKESAGKAAKLQKLVAQKDEILAQYKAGSISLDQYKTKIGNIPQQIKQLRLDMSDELNPKAGTDEEGNEELVTNQTPDKDTDVSGVEAGALQKMAGGTQYPDDMGDDEETAPSRIDMDYYQGDQDEIQEGELPNQQPAGKPKMPPVPGQKPAMPKAPNQMNSGELEKVADAAYNVSIELPKAVKAAILSKEEGDTLNNLLHKIIDNAGKK